MNQPAHIQAVDHHGFDIASRIHAVQMRAYAQEAKLLGAIDFPPLQRTVVDIRTGAESFLAAFVGDELAGALGFSPDEEGPATNVASLVVDPAFQRRGIGRSLLSTFLAGQVGDVTVQTGAGNGPALSLYAELGFVEERRWFVGREPLELVKLRRKGNGNHAI